ncbi:hypothetical protein AYI68_g1568 [Smittium mucronatum]|uniref:Uncharacterized protein n=1 Tax=Smittium mucronatum TaxID=133383 RepID=A0A1R0H4W6_9FUNG|nr:hypothetical protein AYI68_g1568 [Smittium mucronatum]
MLLSRITRFSLYFLASLSPLTAVSGNGTGCTLSYGDISIGNSSNSDEIGSGYTKAIKVPCSKSTFQVDFEVSGSTDTFFSISGGSGIKSIAGRIGIVSGRYGFNASGTYPTTISGLSGRADVSIKVGSTGACLIHNGKQVDTVTFASFGIGSNNMAEQPVYVSFSGGDGGDQAFVSSIKIVCSGEDSSCPASSGAGVAVRLLADADGTDVCASASFISPVSFDSTTITKNYDTEAPFMVPCVGGDVYANFKVNSDSDIFVAFTSGDGFFGKSGVIEAHIGVLSGKSSIKRGVYSHKRSIEGGSNGLGKRYIMGSIDVYITNSTVEIDFNGRIVISYAFKGIEISQMYISSNSGILYVASGYIHCDSASFCNDPVLPCSSTRKLPSQTLNATISKTFDSKNEFLTSCYGNKFGFMANVVATSDIYVLVAEPGGLSFSFAEIRFGIQSGINSIGPSTYFSPPDPNISSQTGPPKSASIGFQYDNGTVSMSVGGKQVGSQTFGAKSYTPYYLYFSTLGGTATLTNRVFTCFRQQPNCP